MLTTKFLLSKLSHQLTMTSPTNNSVVVVDGPDDQHADSTPPHQASTSSSSHHTTFAIPVAQRPKLAGWQFYEHVLGSPRLVVAPMVDQSELAWRMLSRRHGAQLCYTPMFHATNFTQDPKYRAQALQSCSADRPLILQFCGNDPAVLLEAALLAQDHCDAVDINLGCPQAIAKRGHYGAYLQDEWELLATIVRTLHERLAVPVTCKIRIFDDIERTVRYAQMLERAGAQLLTVHGRTRDQKGPLTGVADWSAIRRVRASVSVPMFANGNIMCMADVQRCLEETGVQGIMTAEGNLHNPALFDAAAAAIAGPAMTWDVADEYLDLVDRYPCPVSYVRGHLFKVLHHLLALRECAEVRERIAIATQLGEFRTAVRWLRERFTALHEGGEARPVADAVVPVAEETEKENNDEQKKPLTFNLSLPPWLCQPYVRLEPDVHRRLLAEKSLVAEDPQRERPIYLDDEGNRISRKQAKKLKRVIRRPNYQRGGVRRERALELCAGDIKCGNPMGLRCDHSLCRACCKAMCRATPAPLGQCVGHKHGPRTMKRIATGDGIDDDGPESRVEPVDTEVAIVA